MTSDALLVETSPDHRTVQALREHLYRYNVASTGGVEGEELAVFLRGPDGEIRGGLYGWTWSGWLEINLLWVHESKRGQGHGTRMLAAVEEEARSRGCHTAIVDTHSFQAPGFYQQHGYQVYAELAGYPAGHSKLFLRKSLLGVSSDPDGSPG